MTAMAASEMACSPDMLVIASTFAMASSIASSTFRVCCATFFSMNDVLMPARSSAIPAPGFSWIAVCAFVIAP